MTVPPPRPSYRPDDQLDRLGPPPWDMLDERVADWERAHGHDVRLSCDNWRCMVAEDEAYQRGWADALRYVELRHGDRTAP